MKLIFISFFFLLMFSQCQNPEPVLDFQVNGNPASINRKTGTSDTSGKPTIKTSNNPRQNGRINLKKKHFADSVNLSGIKETGLSRQDWLTQRLQYLKSSGITPDFNESSMRKTFLGPTNNEPFKSMIELSREVFLQFNFDNDILDYTDRFYTNGIRISLIAPGFQGNPVNKILIPYQKSATNYYGLSVVQNMYTPSTTKTGGIQYGDRPYSAYLYIGSFKITNDRLRKYRQTSELDIGIIGPDSYGEWVQRSFHNSVPTNNEPLGWEYQVKNDLVLNYSLSVEKAVISDRSYEIMVIGTGNLGTLYTNLSGGVHFRTGLQNPYFSNLGISKKKETEKAGQRKFQLFFFLKGSGQLVGYDATLQGGLLNKSSVYTIPGNEISRLVFKGSAGISLSHNGIGVDVEQFLLSPEYQNGLWHKWVHIAVKFAL